VPKTVKEIGKTVRKINSVRSLTGISRQEYVDREIEFTCEPPDRNIFLTVFL
jgi:hypothetical protein